MIQSGLFFQKQKTNYDFKNKLRSFFGWALKIFFLSVLYIQSGQSQQLCDSSPFLFGWRGPLPSHSVTNLFNHVINIKINQKNIYGLFTPHLSNQGNQILNFIQGNREKTIQNLMAFLESQWTKVESEKNDVSDIINLLSHNPQIKWIGIESSELEINRMPIQLMLQDYQEVKNLYQDEIKLNFEEIDNLLHLIFHTYIIAFSKYPELFQDIQFVPLEDNVLKRTAIILMRRIQSLQRQIIYTSHQIHLPFSEFEKIEIIQSRALENTETIPETQIKMALDRLSDRGLKDLVSKYFSSTNAFIENSLERDKAIANRVSKQSGEGLIILGSKHRRGVIKQLLSLCREL